MTTSRRQLTYWIAGLSLLAAAFLLFAPPIAQDESYHVFADGRTILGIPNFWNVVSNLPFAVVGILGLWKLRGPVNRVMFAGVLLTCLGSAYYHWAPSDSRLIWDRLPMTLVFMSFLASIASDRNPRSTVRLLLFLLACGAGSVIWWSITNDLRPYVLVQFGPMLILLPLLRCAPGRRDLWAILGLYGLAKIAELCDRAVYSVAPVSGHTCKHVLAAMAAYYIFRWRLSSRTDSMSARSLCADGMATLRAIPG